MQMKFLKWELSMLSVNLARRALIYLIAVILIFFILNCLTVLLPQGHFREHIRVAFNQGELVQKSDLGFDTLRGEHQYQDCLILEQTLNLSPEYWQNVLNAPYFGDNKCTSLHNVVFGYQQAEQHGLSYYQFIKQLSLTLGPKTHKPLYYPKPYYQYLHGDRIFTLVAVSLLHVKIARFVYQKFNYFLVFLISLLIAISPTFAKSKRLIFAGVFFVAFSFFNGLDFFGMNFSHGLGSMLDFIAFILIIRLLRLKQYSSFLIMLLVVGAFSAYFEYLIGILPTITCFIAIGILFVYSSTDLKIKPALKLMIYGVIFYLAGFILTYFSFMLIKLAITGHMPIGFGDDASFSWKVWLGTFDLRVSHQVNGNNINFGNAFGMLWNQTFWIDSDTYLAKPLLYLSFIGIIISGTHHTFISVFKKRSLMSKDAIVILLAFVPYLIVVIWVYLFQNHTFIHCWFMARMLTCWLLVGWFVSISYFYTAFTTKSRLRVS